jgi:hypothetical protein
VDPGFIGNTTLVPTTFSTGSYGWKGTKRITIELENSEGGKEKEKVQVMLTYVFLSCVIILRLTASYDPMFSINATVMGSKNASSDGDGKEGAEGDVEGATEENGEEPQE